MIGDRHKGSLGWNIFHTNDIDNSHRMEENVQKSANDTTYHLKQTYHSRSGWKRKQKYTAEMDQHRQGGLFHQFPLPNALVKE